MARGDHRLVGKHHNPQPSVSKRGIRSRYISRKRGIADPVKYTGVDEALVCAGLMEYKPRIVFLFKPSDLAEIKSACDIIGGKRLIPLLKQTILDEAERIQNPSIQRIQL